MTAHSFRLYLIEVGSDVAVEVEAVVVDAEVVVGVEGVELGIATGSLKPTKTFINFKQGS